MLLYVYSIVPVVFNKLESPFYYFVLDIYELHI